jgi:hypothetical protein
MVTKRPQLLTVAAVRQRKGKPTEYLFNESARVFELADSKDKPSARLLASAHEAGHPLALVVDKQRKLIQGVSKVSEGVIAAYIAERVPLAAPERITSVDVSKIEPVKFDSIDHSRAWGPLRRCTRVVPGYAKAKEIFDFCANVSCSLPGPYAVAPCIPFQYVVDGCYARAHQMRRIIASRYHYCCDKIFSFATTSGARLAVRANKWGGCCVTWWYHVAPIITVRTAVWSLHSNRPSSPKRPQVRAERASINLAYVIDPGMFDQPVLLSTWLGAQENGSCFANAKVTSYSIQPGTAYTPAGTSGSFSTDPSYTLTEATLLDYANLTTC